MTAPATRDILRETQKKYCSKALSIAIAIGLICIFTGFKPIGKGLLLGTLFSIINFVIMGETLPSRLSHSKRKTFLLSLSSIGFRYILLAIPLYVGIEYKTYNFLAVTTGIFAIQLVLITDHLYILLLNGYRKRRA